MFEQHENGISKTRRIIGYVLSLLPALGVMGSGFTKFFPDNEIHALLEQLGMAEHAVLIGLIEIGVVLLYLIPKTSNIGFFLFCSYIGGIIVGELVIGDVPLPGLTIGVMIYVGTLLRKPSLLGWETATSRPPEQS
jgi:hypothetical protein